VVVVKLNDHRLKPGGVRRCFLLVVVVRLKDHRLKPGGVYSGMFPIAMA
jgi:hypothetical protein